MRRAASGSALIVTLLVALLVTSLGLSLLRTAQTERQVARNETFAAQALYGAEAAAGVVQGWFDRPGAALGFPTDPAVVIRRREIQAGDPLAVSGAEGTEYKQDIDLDANGRDDWFDRPYGPDYRHALIGTARDPDVRITDEGFLERLSREVFGDFPARKLGLRTRVRSIDVYGPPLFNRGAQRVRQGMGRLRVRVAVERRHVASGVWRPVAERSATLTLEAIRYGRPGQGVLHACGDLELSGTLPARWGTVYVGGSVRSPDFPVVPPGPPRAAGSDPLIDALWTDDAAWVAEFSSKLEPEAPIPAPWLRLLVGGSIEGAPAGPTQPFAGPPPPAPGQPAPWSCCDGSNVFQHRVVACPEYDYAFWKHVATSPGRGVRYFAWSAADRFREDGTGVARTVEQHFAEANGEAGLFFFDTTDGQPPHDADGDGVEDNLTPEIAVGGTWHARGMIYLNAVRLHASGLSGGVATRLHAPGEPGIPGGEGWIDLSYPAAIGAGFAPGPAGTRERRGPAIDAPAVFHGLLYNAGSLVAGAGGVYYGSVVVAGDAVLDGNAFPGAIFLLDSDLPTGEWPPAAWRLPRVSRIGLLAGP